MLSIRRAEDRGLANLGWLNSRHTFSFGEYYDPTHMGYGSLRVINEDRVQPGKGFGTHGHRDMEIISYVKAGALDHKDNIGNGSTIRPGDVQRMSAGTGVRHSEFNHSDQEEVHFLQIWIKPVQAGLAPSYEQRHFTAEDKRGQLKLVGSNDGRDGSVMIHQDVDLYASLLTGDGTLSHPLADGRRAWVQVISGHVSVNEQKLGAGDGVAIEGLPTVHFSNGVDVEFLLFDMAV